MSGTDERIVSLQFEGNSFLSGVKNALTALTQLKSGLNGLKGSESDLNSLDEAGKRFSLAGIANSLQGLSGKFSSLSVIGVTALANITNKAVNAGLTLVKSLTLDPITAGFQKYELGINATQRIIANTGASLKVVTAALNDLNTYSNQTIYNFEQMTQAIGQFTAAGIPLKASVADIKGMSNAAALTGASMASLQSAFYQMSQAMAGGVIKLQDWNSLQNAGVADGKEFQQAFQETADSMGHNVDALVAKQGGFRNSLQKGWLTADVFSKAMGVMAGTLNTTTGQTEAYSVAQLKAMGYTESQAVSLHKLSAAALDTATKTRSFSQLLDNLKDDASTAWAHVFQAIIGNLPQATSEFTKLSNVAQNVFLGPVNNLAAFIEEWNKLGGRGALIDAVVNSFKDLSKILGAVKAAFEEVFPSNGNGAANGFVAMTKSLDDFVKKLTPTQATLNDIKTIFEGVFSAVKIVIDVIGSLIGAFTKLGGAASGSGAGGGVLAFIATIASYITKVKDAIESSNALQKIFGALAAVISVPLKALGALTGSLGGVGGALKGTVSGISDFMNKVKAAFSKIGDVIAQGIQSGSISNVLSILNQGIFATVLLAIKKWISGLGKSSAGSGLLDSIKESFESLTGTLKSMQTSLKSDTLLKIAAAVGILAASMVAISFINVANLGKALGAMTILFTELLVALQAVSKIAGSGGIVKMPIIAASLNLLATAILILTGAVAILGHMSWSELEKGLSALGVLLLELAVSTQIMSKNAPGLILTAAAMNLMATAINIMALAVKVLGSLNFGELAKGIGSVAALLLIIAGFQKLSGGDQLISSAAGMILIAAALNLMASAVGKLGSLSFGTLAKGIGSIAAVLLILVVAMNAMQAGIGGAAALAVASASLILLGNALKTMGAESWSSIGKAMVELAGSMIILSAALLVMDGTLPGAAALLVAAAALAVLAPILIALGKQSWENVAIGLVALAGVFLVIGGAGLLLTPLVPVLIALGAAILLLGAGMALAGVGMLAFGTGLAAFAVGLTATGAAIVAFVKNILGLVPTILVGLAQDLAGLGKAVAIAAPALINAFVVLVTAIGEGLVKAVPAAVKGMDAVITGILTLIGKDGPKIITTFLNLLVTLLGDIPKYVPKFVSAIANIILSMITSITKEVPKFASAAASLIIAMINAIGTETVKIVNAAIQMVVNMVNGIANAIKSHQAAMNSAMYNLGKAMIDGLISAIVSLGSGVINAITGLADSAYHAALKALHINSPSKLFMEVGSGIIEGWVLGITSNGQKVANSVSDTASVAIATIGKSVATIGQAIDSQLDLSPRITPVVDLTQAQKGFSTLSTLSKASIINAGTSSSTAASISAANAAAATQAGLLTTAGGQFSFTQNNYSPEALSAIDIYRQTKNQLSRARGVLTA
jgi:tape measure domain-containing protein